MSRATIGCLLMTTLFACGHAPVRPEAEDPDLAVNALLDADYEFTMRTFPIWATKQGDRRYDGEIRDNSPQGMRARLTARKALLERAEAIDAATLTDTGRTNLELLIYELKKSVKAAAFHPEYIPITQMGGPHTSLPQLPTRITFTTEAQFEDYVTRLGKIPGHLDQTMANMRAGLAAKHTPPKVVMAGVMAQFQAQTKKAFLDDPTQSPYYVPFRERPADDPLAKRAASVIHEGIIPALQRLAAFVEGTYIPACRETIAARDGFGGADFYAFRLENFTTLPLTAQEIHDLGLGEVVRIRGEMMETIARSDFKPAKPLKGDALFGAFLEYLRTDPRFYYTESEPMMRDYGHITKQMDAVLPTLFGRLPRLPYGVRAMPDYIAQSAPTAYYYRGSVENGVSGTFIVNTSQLSQRPRYEMKALAFHEAVPGHHLQIALSQELAESGLHRWRELVGYTVFVEGWGLYSERLGLEVGGPEGATRGFYEDPYDDFGRLSYEMWRALRLVVDTGVHALGWPRQRAIDFMLRNSALSRKNVENEVDRYISWPGQAVAYKIGELRIRALRVAAEKALGDDFDIRGFHDTVLEVGAIPLAVLGRRVNAWLARQSAKRSAP